MDVFQILNFPDPVSQLPLDLESWIFFWYALTLCWTKCSIPLWLVWFGLVWSGIWSWFQKIAILKKAFNIFLIFLAKKYCPKPSHRWLKGFAGDELCLGTTDNFVKKSVPASTSQIRPNQTKLAHEVYYILLGIVWEPTTKNFRALGPMGAMIMGPESSKLENCQF